MMTDLEKEEMLHNLANKKTQVVLVNNKIYIEDLVDEIRKDNIPKFEPAERMTGIQTKEDIDRKKREDPVVKKNKRDISEFRLIDGVEYYRWSIFICWLTGTQSNSSKEKLFYQRQQRVRVQISPPGPTFCYERVSN